MERHDDAGVSEVVHRTSLFSFPVTTSLRDTGLFTEEYTKRYYISLTLNRDILATSLADQSASGGGGDNTDRGASEDRGLHGIAQCERKEIGRRG